MPFCLSLSVSVQRDDRNSYIRPSRSSVTRELSWILSVRPRASKSNLIFFSIAVPYPESCNQGIRHRKGSQFKSSGWWDGKMLKTCGKKFKMIEDQIRMMESTCAVRVKRWPARTFIPCGYGVEYIYILKKMSDIDIESMYARDCLRFLPSKYQDPQVSLVALGDQCSQAQVCVPCPCPCDSNDMLYIFFSNFKIYTFERIYKWTHRPRPHNNKLLCMYLVTRRQSFRNSRRPSSLPSTQNELNDVFNAFSFFNAGENCRAVSSHFFGVAVHYFEWCSDVGR